MSITATPSTSFSDLVSLFREPSPFDPANSVMSDFDRALAAMKTATDVVNNQRFENVAEMLRATTNERESFTLSSHQIEQLNPTQLHDYITGQIAYYAAQNRAIDNLPSKR